MSVILKVVLLIGETQVDKGRNIGTIGGLSALAKKRQEKFSIFFVDFSSRYTIIME